MRILLLEDDLILGDGICLALRHAGFTVDWLKNGNMGLQAIQTEELSLIILDLGLPGIDGLEVLKQTRQLHIDTPVLILTARDSIDDRIRGLDIGGDDYLTKPFDVGELIARIRSLIRRSQGRSTPCINIGKIEINPVNQTVIYSGDPVTLSSKEYRILLYLVENSNRPVTRTQLEEQLYGWDQSIDSNALEVHIHNLRKKLTADMIKTIRGFGYQFIEPSN